MSEWGHDFRPAYLVSRFVFFAYPVHSALISICMGQSRKLLHSGTYNVMLAFVCVGDAQCLLKFPPVLQELSTLKMDFPKTPIAALTVSSRWRFTATASSTACLQHDNMFQLLLVVVVLPDGVVCAVLLRQASCTSTVEASIVRQLRMQEPLLIKGGFNRPNIQYKVRPQLLVLCA